MLLLDKGSFCEIGNRIGSFGTDPREDQTPYDGVITGFGTVNGRQVFVFSQDFTVRGGSIGRNHGRKIARIIKMAIDAKKPVIGIYDSGGAGIDEGVSSLAGCGDMMYQNIRASGVIPQIFIYSIRESYVCERGRRKQPRLERARFKPRQEWA